MPVLPATPEEVKALNNLPALPVRNQECFPLGTALNELAAGSGGIPAPGGSATGDILVFNAGVWTNLVPGAVGTFLQSNGAGVLPTYVPSGASLDVVADTYDCAAGIAVNDAVYLSASNTVAKASAQAGGGQTPPAIGFVVSKPTAITAIVCSAGSQLTTSFVGLTPGAQYWLDPVTPGAITSTAPTTAGQAVQQVGKAVTATKLLVEIGESILL